MEERQILDHLQNQLELNPHRFHRIDDPYLKESWGFIRDNITYLTVAGMQSMFRDFSGKIVRKVLLKAGVINKTQSETKTIHNKSARVFELRLGVFGEKT